MLNSQNKAKEAYLLKEEFYVLTCGEHEGKRGVNRLIEKSLGDDINPSANGFYLPGLAACGVEYQDRFGNITHLGLSEKEINFLKELPEKMQVLLIEKLSIIFPNLEDGRLIALVEVAICDTRFTPTLNLNEIFTLANGNIDLQLKLQYMILKVN